ncbi:uncharacterized protein [Engystomops pustulosus]|uniref:uncharacterized protein isoform X2 n=1 Tax=Engystomops pustulosus TaxID=76066 RepID=UPI003AFA609B
MPRCFVERCHNYGGKRLNIILHSFPNNLDKIKTWLRCIERSGHVIRDIDELAERIFEGKTNNRFRVCSEHFSEQSYQPSGLRKTLRKDAVPTIFRDVPPQKCPWQKSKPVTTDVALCVPPEPSHLPNRLPQANIMTTTKATECFQQNTWKSKGYDWGPNRRDVPHVILTLTLEIICLLMGEDYIIVKKTSRYGEGWSRTQSVIMEPPPDSPIDLKRTKQKILELTTKILELVTAENCEHVEGHQKDVRTDSHQALSSLDTMVNGLSDPSSVRIMEESSCEKEDMHITTHHGPQDQFSNIKVEAVTSGGRNFSDPKYQQYPSPPIKEECPLCDQENLTNPNIHSSTGHTQQHGPGPIKEEPVSCDNADLTDANLYTPTDHTRYRPPLVKDEGECLVDIYTPAGSMAEPTPDNGRSLTSPTHYAQHHPSHCDIVDPASCDGAQNPSSAYTEGENEDSRDNYSVFDKGNLDTDIYALIKHAQAKYTFTRIEDGSSSEEEDNARDTEAQTPSDHPLQRPPNAMREAVPQTFQCPDCSESFTRKSGLINHRRNHRQEKLTCSKCGKVFSKRSSLQNHLTLHTGEKPYACPVCGKCFARKSNLVSHETIHSGKASFTCAECGRYFVCKVHLTKHQIIHEK